MAQRLTDQQRQEIQRNDVLREKVAQRLSRTLMRLPDKVDQIHLGELLAEVWEEGYEAGVSTTNYPDGWVCTNPFSPS